MFKLASLVKKLILESDILLSNIPKHDYYSKFKIKDDITNILYLIHLANNIEDTNSRQIYQYNRFLSRTCLSIKIYIPKTII